DGDGVADLLAGDQKTITLTKEQRLAGASEDDLKRFAEAEAKLKEFQVKSKEISQGVDFQSLSDEEKTTHRNRLKALFDSYRQYQTVVYEEFPERKMHGYVWVFKGIKE
ncbi:MAG: hypothetical protein MI702_03280, partial [Chlorobiales bacterium]|nr:hypothetical protein [Chlorobiales bacterium]